MSRLIDRFQNAKPYLPTDPHNQPVEHSRTVFLDFYSRFEPELLRKLRDRVLPLFCVQCPTGLTVIDAADLHAMLAEPEHAELMVEVTAWANDFELILNGKPAEWAMLFALATLELWQRSPKALEKLKWGRPAGLYEEFPFGGERGFFSITGEPDGEIFLASPQALIWDWTAGESEREFRRRHRLHYAKAAQQYAATVKEEIRRRGWTGTPLAGCEYLEALAMRKVGESLISIRTLMRRRGMNVGCEGDLSAVAHGIERAANSIHIDPPTYLRRNLK